MENKIYSVTLEEIFFSICFVNICREIINRQYKNKIINVSGNSVA